MVIQSKLDGDGDRSGPYIPFLTVWSGTLCKHVHVLVQGYCSVYNILKNPTKKKKKQASARLLGSVCTAFWLGGCWLDVASTDSFSLSIFFPFSCFFLFFLFFFFTFLNFRTLKFSQLINSSSTFKYIVGLSLKIEIWLCILCTVSLKLCTATAVLQVYWSAGKLGRVAWEEDGNGDVGLQMAKCKWRGF